VAKGSRDAEDVARDRKRDLYRAALARSDVQAALQASEALIEARPDPLTPLFWALQSAVVICYARPFVKVRGDSVGVLPKRLSRLDDPEQKALHQMVLDLRRQTVAHSDPNVRKVFITPKGSRLPDTDIRAGNLEVGVVNAALPWDAIEKMPALCTHFREALTIEVRSLLSQLYGDEFYVPDAFVLEWPDSRDERESITTKSP
jgi:hypothetical protein